MTNLTVYFRSLRKETEMGDNFEGGTLTPSLMENHLGLPTCDKLTDEHDTVLTMY